MEPTFGQCSNFFDRFHHSRRTARELGNVLLGNTNDLSDPLNLATALSVARKNIIFADMTTDKSAKLIELTNQLKMIHFRCVSEWRRDFLLKFKQKYLPIFHLLNVEPIWITPYHSRFHCFPIYLKISLQN